jgi:hypothetical protein
MNARPEQGAFRARCSRRPTGWLVARPDATADATPVHEARVLTEGGAWRGSCWTDQIYTLRITRAGKLILTK